MVNRQRPCKCCCLRPGYTRGRRSAVRQPERIALRIVNSRLEIHTRIPDRVADFCRCELPRLLPPICTASQCFYSDGVGHKKSKKQRRNQSKCRFHWTLMDVLGSPWICRLRDYSALTRLAPAGPPSKTPAFNFAWRRSCRTRLLSVGGSNGRRRAVETWRGFPKFLWGFAG